MKDYLPEHYVTSKFNHPGSNHRNCLLLSELLRITQIFQGWNLDKLRITLRLDLKILILTYKKKCKPALNYFGSNAKNLLNFKKKVLCADKQTNWGEKFTS